MLRAEIKEARMAQVWLSFEEIQELFSCDAADARRRVIANQWERRRCTDGLVRTQVPADVAHDFFTLRFRKEPEAPPAPANGFEAAMAALCQVFAEAADAPSAEPVDAPARVLSQRVGASPVTHLALARRAVTPQAETGTYG
jgi:hypothetical protein